MAASPVSCLLCKRIINGVQVLVPFYGVCCFHCAIRLCFTRGKVKK